MIAKILNIILHILFSTSLLSHLLKTVIIINAFSLAILFSLNSELFLNQCIKIIISSIILFLLTKLPDLWDTLSLIFYIITIITLIINLFLQSKIKRWITIAGFSIQFSQFAKIATILMLARILSQKKFALIKSLLIICLPTILIFKQPNLGTAFMLALTGFLMIILTNKIQKNVLIIGTISSILYLPFLWNKMLPYQKNRILAFLHPSQDPVGNSYQTTQSIIAVGNGGVFGSEALQNKLGFVPENHTDFLFSYFAEKNGFIITFFLLLIMLTGILTMIKITQTIHNQFKKIFCLGFTILWSIEFFFNVGMNVGLLPVTGISLPYFSYGGSQLLAFFIALGIIINMHKHNKEIE